MKFSVLKSMGCVSALVFVSLMPVALAAQVVATTTGKTVAGDSPSRWDIFVGYSYLSPDGKIAGTRSGAPGSTYGQINWGGIVSVSRYFNKNFGLQFEGSEHMQSEDWPIGDNDASFNSNDDFAGGSAGLIYRIPTAHFTPFLHVLGGAERVGSVYEVDAWHPAGTAGGGLDINTPLFGHHLGIRLFQADYQYIHTDSSEINAFRLSTGAVFHIGSIAPPLPITLSCSASPSSVYPGEPVTVTATAGALNPKMNVLYSYSGTGVTGSGVTASVDTASLAPGSYTVKCEVKEGKPGREGLKPWEIADSSASFTVKAYEPPTISCSSSPSTIKPGETSTITAMGMSPQNRPLTYSYTTDSGTISGSGASAIFSSTGAPTGSAAIVCNVSDDKGQTATANTSVTITAPYVAVIAHTQALCSISFEKDSKRPARVDNEAKACLDEVAMDLQKQSDAKAVLVGHSTSAEKTPRKGRKHAQIEDLAAQRAVNTKDYLVTEKGIDASRVSVVTSATDDQKVEDYLVPSGATFTADVAGTTAVDETTVKAQARKPLTAAPIR
jgi:outer membrane protein OmpA-like peptidoglycan-associated protein